MAIGAPTRILVARVKHMAIGVVVEKEIMLQ